MITAGVAALSKLAPALEDPDESLLPALKDLRHVSVKVATAVANAAREEGVSQVQQDEPWTEDDVSLHSLCTRSCRLLTTLTVATDPWSSMGSW